MLGHSDWQLIDEKTGAVLCVGMTLTTFRGETVTLLGGTPPHKPSSSGFVSCVDEHGNTNEWFAGVVGAKWRRA